MNWNMATQRLVHWWWRLALLSFIGALVTPIVPVTALFAKSQPNGKSSGDCPFPLERLHLGQYGTTVQTPTVSEAGPSPIIQLPGCA